MLRQAVTLAILTGCGLMGLSGCASSSLDAAASTGLAVNSHDVAQRFADCMTAQGIDGIFVNDDGVVGVSVTAPPKDAAGGAGSMSIGADNSGYSAADELCRSQNPDYHDGSTSVDPAMTAQIVSQGRVFATCARANGLGDFPDPSPDGTLPVPDGVTKTQFLAVVTSCASAFTLSADDTAAASGDDASTFTFALPQFTGAYDPSWTDEVNNILFSAAGPTPAANQ